MNRTLFKNRNFVLLMLGKLVSLMGTRIQNFALSLYVLDQTGSSMQFASLLALGFLPELFIGPFAGVIVDWCNKRNLIVRLDLLSGAITLLSSLLLINQGKLFLYQIYILTISFSLINTLFNPAIRTLLPLTVDKSNLFEANTINSFIMNLGFFIGPILGGFIYSRSSLFIILFINGMSFMFSAVSEYFIAYEHTPITMQNGRLQQFKSDLTLGFTFVKGNSHLLMLVLLCFTINFFLYPVMSLGVVYIPKTTLKASNELIGVLQGFMTLGMLIAPLFAKKLQELFTTEKLIITGEVLMGLLIAFMAIAPWIKEPLIAIAYFSFMSFGVLFILSIVNISISTSLQSIVPKHFLGRVSTINNSISTGAMPIGQWFFGYFLNVLPASLCLSFNGIMIIVFSLVLGNKLVEVYHENCNSSQ